MNKIAVFIIIAVSIASLAVVQAADAPEINDVWIEPELDISLFTPYRFLQTCQMLIQLTL